MDENKIKEIIRESSSPFLVAAKGKWINGDSNVLVIKDMDSEYKNNCLKYLKNKIKPNIKHGDFISGIKGVNKSDVNEIIQYAEILCDQKINELEFELKKQ